jgi:hypothetical protein
MTITILRRIAIAGLKDDALVDIWAAAGSVDGQLSGSVANFAAGGLPV